MVANNFLFKRTSRNSLPVYDIPLDLITVFCSVCLVECTCPPYRWPLHPWEIAHNNIVGIVNHGLKKFGLRVYVGNKIADRPVCHMCYQGEMGLTKAEANATPVEKCES